MSGYQLQSDGIVIAGSGNMAWHLARTFCKANVKIENIISRNSIKGQELAIQTGAKYSSDFGKPFNSRQIIILAISDSSINEVLEKINLLNNIIVHTSGSVGLEIFKGKAKECGVIYPFQTLTWGIETDFSRIPIFIEGSDDHVYEILNSLVSLISRQVILMNSEQRKKLHLAGVLLNNFTNHLTALSLDYLENNKINKQYAIPLLQETLRKIETIGPREAQTGPARRKNLDIIESHLELLKDDLLLKNLYKEISDSIIAYYS